MFTGIIQQMGTVTEVKNIHGNRIFKIQCSFDKNDPFIQGESVSVDGVCLTIRDIAKFTFEVEAVKETLSLSTLRHFQPGQRVNLERALSAQDRFGGHIVLGHVDSTGIVKEIQRDLKNVVLFIRFHPKLHPYICFKGSIAVNGVSLTVSSLEPGIFGVSLVEFTLKYTNLARLRESDEVNLEIDIIARYIERFITSEIKGSKKFTYIQEKRINL